MNHSKAMPSCFGFAPESSGSTVHAVTRVGRTSDGAAEATATAAGHSPANAANVDAGSLRDEVDALDHRGDPAGRPSARTLGDVLAPRGDRALLDRRRSP